ncbi:O-antigen ligase family protein [Formosa sp. 4Alg 33]|uniref:O-antigen ligase family protein n=1 Tax=Formosa sp. 4Alg 33 TaxID=3382189 RepID=UPI003D9C5DF4
MELNKLAFKTVIISIFLIPFTFSDTRLFLNLGEFRNETYIYPLLLAVLIFGLTVIFKGKIKVPLKNNYFILIGLFSLWCFLTFVFNFFEIQSNVFKDTKGVSRFLGQFLSLIFCVLIVPITLYNILEKYDIHYVFGKIEKVIRVSLICVFIASVLQILSVIYHVSIAHNIIQLINENISILYIREDVLNQRISGTSHEPPFLGMYLIFIFPWFLRRLITFKPKKVTLVYIFIIFILVFYSRSRAAQLFCLIELIVFIVFLVLNRSKALVYFLRTLIFIVMFLPFLFLWKGQVIVSTINERIDSFKIVKNIETNNSNKTRMGTIIAGMETFNKNPFAGVGYGQQGFYLLDNYPEWAVKGNWEIERYKEGKQKNFPPGFNIYVRYLAETGIIGFLLFIIFLIYILYTTLNKYILTKDVNYLFFFTTFIGFIVNWVQIDTPRIYGFWITFVLLLIFQKQTEHDRPQVNSVNSSL